LIRTLLAASLLATTTAAAQTRPRLPNDSVAIARKYATWITTNRFDSLIAHRAPGDPNTVTATEMSDRYAQVWARVGTEATLVEERWVRRNGQRQYWRVARYSDFADEPVVLRVVINPDGSYGGDGINPLSRVPPIDPEP
jgi:hypothetical protein